jgi:outer membrane protein assembly factor BamB
MIAVLAIFAFGQTGADVDWPMYGATLENTHYQEMVGAMETAPYVKWSYATEDWVECHGAAVADIDGDGAMEVVIGSNDDKVYCLDGVTGLLEWSYPTGGSVFSSPAAADIDGDDTMEVVVGSYDSNIYCLNGITGLVEWSYAAGGPVYSSPSVANVDGVTGMEVVVGSINDKVYCLDGATGTIKWSYQTGDDVFSSPAVADVDEDGDVEVVIGSDDHKVYCLNGATGVVKWSYPTGDKIYSSPAAADVDGITGMEVVIGSNDNNIYCLNGATGLVKWSYATGGSVWSSPAVADVDGNDTMQVVIGSHDGKVYRLNGVTGAMEWSYDIGGPVHRGISVADLDGDIADECKLEILVPNNYTDLLTCLNGEDGSVLWTKQLATDVHDITIADIDNDGCVELVMGTESSNKIWALDDVGNHTDCECDSSASVEESSAGVHPPQGGIGFRAVNGGTGRMPVLLLFTPNAVEVDIGVYDVCGRLKQVLYKGVLSKGGHTFMPRVQGHGVYFAVLHTHGFRGSLKITRF